MTGAGPGTVARRPRAARRRQRAVWLRIGLGILRSRPFREWVVLAVIAMAAVTRIAREGRTRMFGRLAAWDRRERLRLQRKAGGH